MTPVGTWQERLARLSRPRRRDISSAARHGRVLPDVADAELVVRSAQRRLRRVVRDRIANVLYYEAPFALFGLVRYGTLRELAPQLLGLLVLGLACNVGLAFLSDRPRLRTAVHGNLEVVAGQPLEPPFPDARVEGILAAHAVAVAAGERRRPVPQDGPPDPVEAERLMRTIEREGWTRKRLERY